MGTVELWYIPEIWKKWINIYIYTYIYIDIFEYYICKFRKQVKYLLYELYVA